MTINPRVTGLVNAGYTPTVAKKLAEARPDLAEDPQPPVLAYRGLSGRTFDPKAGTRTGVVVSSPSLGPARAIRKAQEFALGVFYGNTKPSPDGYYTVVEYQLPRDVLDQKGVRDQDTFERSKVPNEMTFVSRVGTFHLQQHAPVSDIEWHDASE